MREESRVDILDCGHAPSPHSPITTGYGVTEDGKRHCYDCCAHRVRVRMIETGKGVLYLSGKELTDWPGKLRFPVYAGYIAKGRHNMARVRYDGQFIGPDGKRWRFTQYGDNTQIAHCRRLKAA